MTTNIDNCQTNKINKCLCISQWYLMFHNEFMEFSDWNFEIRLNISPKSISISIYLFRFYTFAHTVNTMMTSIMVIHQFYFALLCFRCEVYSSCHVVRMVNLILSGWRLWKSFSIRIDFGSNSKRFHYHNGIWINAAGGSEMRLIKWNMKNWKEKQLKCVRNGCSFCFQFDLVLDFFLTHFLCLVKLNRGGRGQCENGSIWILF